MHLPNLVEIRMADPPGRIGCYYWRNEKWILLDEVEEECVKGGVTLDVRFSFPHPGSNMDLWNERKSKSRYALAEYHYYY
jgi:hypothetical protein